MSDINELNSTPLLLVSYEEVKRHLLIDHDLWREDIIDAIQEVVDEIQLLTNDYAQDDEVGVHSIRFDNGDSFLIPGQVFGVIEVRDGDNTLLNHSAVISGTAIRVTPTVDFVLPVTIVYRRVTVRPVLRRIVKEMVAWKLRFRGDEPAAYPANIQRVLQQLTNFQL